MGQELGQNTICQDCTARKDNEWTVFPCDPHHTSDAVYQECSECVPGEYLFADCTVTSDTVCPRCPDAAEKLYSGSQDFKSGLQYCDKDPETDLYLIRCHAEENDDGVVEPDASTCGYWSDDIDDEGEVKPRCTHEFMGGGNCGTWHSDCLEDFSGESCCYHKYPYNWVPSRPGSDRARGRVTLARALRTSSTSAVCSATSSQTAWLSRSRMAVRTTHPSVRTR